MRACIIALICVSSYAFSFAPVNRISGSPGTFEDLVLSQEIPDFTMTQGSLFDGLKNLSSGPIPFRVGFEEVLRARFDDTAKPDPHFDLHLRNKTVREILNALCLADP